MNSKSLKNSIWNSELSWNLRIHRLSKLELVELETLGYGTEIELLNIKLFIIIQPYYLKLLFIVSEHYLKARSRKPPKLILIRTGRQGC